MLPALFICFLAFLGPVFGIDHAPLRAGRNGKNEFSTIEFIDKEIWPVAEKLDPATGDTAVSNGYTFNPDQKGSLYLGWDNHFRNLGVLMLYENAAWMSNIPRKIAMPNSKRASEGKFHQIFGKGAWSKPWYGKYVNDFASCDEVPGNQGRENFMNFKEREWKQNGQQIEGQMLFGLVMTTWNGKRQAGNDPLRPKYPPDMSDWSTWIAEAARRENPGMKVIVVAPRWRTQKEDTPINQRYVIRRELKNGRISYVIFFAGATLAEYNPAAEPKITWSPDFYYMRGYEPDPGHYFIRARYVDPAPAAA